MFSTLIKLVFITGSLAFARKCDSQDKHACDIPEQPNMFFISRVTLMNVTSIPLKSSTFSACLPGYINVGERPTYGFCSFNGYHQKTKIDCQKGMCRIPRSMNIYVDHWDQLVTLGQSTEIESLGDGQRYTIVCKEGGKFDGLAPLMGGRYCRLPEKMISDGAFIVYGYTKGFEAPHSEYVRLYCPNKTTPRLFRSMECKNGEFRGEICTGRNCKTFPFNENVCD